MTRWTHLVIRFRWPVLGLWLVVLVLGLGASTQLSKLLSNTFIVPGTDSEQVRTTLEKHFGDRSDGAFTVVFRVKDADAPGSSRRARPPSCAVPARRCSTRTSPRASSSPRRRATRTG